VTAEMSHSTAQFLFFNSENMGRMSTGFLDPGKHSHPTLEHTLSVTLTNHHKLPETKVNYLQLLQLHIVERESDYRDSFHCALD
jgi:hypothetical protein